MRGAATLPDRAIDILLMDRFKWSWRALQDTPAHIVITALKYIAIENSVKRDIQREAESKRL